MIKRKAMPMIPLLPGRKRPLLYAHRGCSSLAPENTFASFSLARTLGSPGIELDVHLAASGELVVIHDDTFLRTAGDPRAVESLSWREISAIDVGSFFDTSHKNERVLLLESVLEEFCPGMYFDIEMKTKKTRGDLLPIRLAEKLRALGDRVTQAVSVSSFNPISLRAFKKAAPSVPAALIWSAGREVPLPLRRGLGCLLCPCDYYKPEYAQFNTFINSIRYTIRKRPIALWTIDTGASARQFVSRGAEALITNRPQDMPEEWRLR
jgi:glycerophosphoryl diester phosphodiesterase